MKNNKILFLATFIISFLLVGFIKIGNMPKEVLRNSYEKFTAVEEVDEIKVKAPWNKFVHSKLYTADLDANDAGFTAPMADMLYSIAWLDIEEEPVILQVPDYGNRYYAICFTTDLNINSGYIGTRVTGKKGGNYLIVSESWKGTIPEGYKVLTVTSNKVNAFVRTFVDGPTDLAIADSIRREIKILKYLAP